MSCRRTARLGAELTRRVLAFPEPEGDEAVGRIVGRHADLDPIPGDHANPKAAHATRELRGHALTAFEGDLVAAAAEDLVHGSGRLNQVITCQSDASTSVNFERHAG